MMLARRLAPTVDELLYFRGLGRESQVNALNSKRATVKLCPHLGSLHGPRASGVDASELKRAKTPLVP